MSPDSVAFDHAILDWVCFYLFWVGPVFHAKRAQTREDFAVMPGYPHSPADPFCLKVVGEEKFMREPFPVQYSGSGRRMKRLIPFVH